jgi:protein-disulfide isomerase
MKRILAAVGLGLSLAGSLTLPTLAADAAPSGQAAAQALDQALLAYQEAADAMVASKGADLLRDPRTPVLGNANGPVPVVEFFDYQCPYCKAIEPKLEALVKDDHDVKLVIKEFPILGPASVVAAKAALAAVRQGKYEAYHNAMMAFRGKLTDDVIFDTAKDVGLDVARLRKDMEAPEIADALLANMNLARAMKMSITPGIIVGNHIYSGLSPTTSSGKIDFPKAVAAAHAGQ